MQSYFRAYHNLYANTICIQFWSKNQADLTEVRKAEHMACVQKSLMFHLVVLGSSQDSEVGTLYVKVRFKIMLLNLFLGEMWGLTARNLHSAAPLCGALRIFLKLHLCDRYSLTPQHPCQLTPAWEPTRISYFSLMLDSSCCTRVEYWIQFEYGLSLPLFSFSLCIGLYAQDRNSIVKHSLWI